MDNFLEVVKTRKSIRNFKLEPVPREIVEEILALAVYAPTNCNQQLWNFIVVEDAQTKERLIKEAASNTLIRRAPVLIVVSYDGWNYKEAIQGGALAVGNILLAAQYYGLGALPMNSYGSDKKVKSILNIPENETICCFVLLGYADEEAKNAPLVPRKNASEVTHWGTYIERTRPPFSYNPEDWTTETLIAHQRHYCRKTFLGKEMDIMSSAERELVKRTLDLGIDEHKSFIDFMTYDGAYVREFPTGIDLTTIDLCRETADYTKVACKSLQNVHSFTLGEEYSGAMKYDYATLIYKLERLPKSLRTDVFTVVHDSLKEAGEFIIIARKGNFFLAIFFSVIKFLFGKDIRKTGIYNFFGPYRPISLRSTIQELKQAGFKQISYESYFPFPTFYEQAYQMYLQFKASDGTSYLHREKRTDFISKLINFIIQIQGFRNAGLFGSVVIIKCKKK